MPYFTRSEKEFYANERGQACFRMVVDCHEGSKIHESVVCWDFAMGTLTLDGDIPEPEFFSEFFRDAIVDRELAFFALFAAGVFAPDIKVEGADDARIAWASAARAFLLELEGEKMTRELENIFASGDGEEVDEKHVHEVTFAAQWVRNNHDARQGILLAQFPPVDGVKDVWTEDAEGWTAATVRGSHTIPAHIGVDPNSRAWQSALDTLKKWAAEHGENPFIVHAENDGDYLALEDIADARLYAEFELVEED